MAIFSYLKQTLFDMKTLYNQTVFLNVLYTKYSQVEGDIIIHGNAGILTFSHCGTASHYDNPKI